MPKFVKIEREDMGFYIQPVKDLQGAVEGEIIEGEVGETVKFTLIEMTQEEYDALPEFAGW